MFSENNVSRKRWCISCHLLNAVSSCQRSSVSPYECSPGQHVHVVVLRRVGGTLEHVQHPLSDQETTCKYATKKGEFLIWGEINLVFHYYCSVKVLNVRPAMLMEETNAAARARLSGRVEGVRPPPIRTRPPTAVKPDRETPAKKLPPITSPTPGF